MNVLVPIDGSDCSIRALEFAVKIADCFEATLDVVHFSDTETEATDTICDRAEEVVPGDVPCSIRVLTESDLDFRPADKVGDYILDLVESGEYDHVVMGHHGDGALDRAILGSAAEKVVRAETVPVTIVP